VGGALEKLRCAAGPGVRLVDWLRVCVTLPCMWASAPPRPRARMSQALQATLAQALRQGVAQEQPLLEVAAACFLHYLSHLRLFLEEAAAEKSAFPLGSQIADFFVAALTAALAGRGAELSQIAVRIADRARYVMDRDPGADPQALQKAAYVLRYVAEKRCRELGAAVPSPVGAESAAAMPAELFAVRPGLGAVAAPALPLANPEAEEATALLPLEDGSAVEVDDAAAAAPNNASASHEGAASLPETFLHRRPGAPGGRRRRAGSHGSGDDAAEAEFVAEALPEPRQCTGVQGSGRRGARGRRRPSGPGRGRRVDVTRRAAEHERQVPHTQEAVLAEAVGDIGSGGVDGGCESRAIDPRRQARRKQGEFYFCDSQATAPGDGGEDDGGCKSGVVGKV